jgi:hypothetical protein
MGRLLLFETAVVAMVCRSRCLELRMFRSRSWFPFSEKWIFGLFCSAGSLWFCCYLLEVGPTMVLVCCLWWLEVMRCCCGGDVVLWWWGGVWIWRCRCVVDVVCDWFSTILDCLTVFKSLLRFAGFFLSLWCFQIYFASLWVMLMSSLFASGVGV